MGCRAAAKGRVASCEFALIGRYVELYFLLSMLAQGLGSQPSALLFLFAAAALQQRWQQYVIM
jgi:hypothetical protein